MLPNPKLFQSWHDAAEVLDLGAFGIWGWELPTGESIGNIPGSEEPRDLRHLWSQVFEIRGSSPAVALCNGKHGLPEMSSTQLEWIMENWLLGYCLCQHRICFQQRKCCLSYWKLGQFCFQDCLSLGTLSSTPGPRAGPTLT